MAVKRRIHVTVNGEVYDHEVEPRLLLVDYLRDYVGLAGTHYGCDTTSCGACTVIVDGRSAKSCTRFAVQADGKAILTVEGLAKQGELHPIQQAMWREHGMQCGFCTSGMIMSAKALLEENPNPNEEDIREGISGNFCRCTGYTKIFESISAAADLMKGGE